jgi:hypothetical protein
MILTTFTKLVALSFGILFVLLFSTYIVKRIRLQVPVNNRDIFAIYTNMTIDKVQINGCNI